MPLTVLTLEQANEWDAIVRSFHAYDIYYFSGYVKAFKLHGDGEPLLFFYDDNNLRAINVVMKRDIAKEPYFNGKINENELFDFATPYGYGGWIIEGEGLKSLLFAAYESWCRNNMIVSEFIRFHPVLQNHLQVQGYDIVPVGKTIVLPIDSPDTIWSNLTSNYRNMIKKAIKNGVRIYSGRNPTLYKEFMTLYNATMLKNNAAPYYYFDNEFYASLLNDLPHNAQIFYAEYEKAIIAASIILSANGRLSYHLSGSLKEYKSLAPNNLLLYEAALWGAANGCKTFHLGGGVGSKEDSLFEFKKSFFRGEPCRFYIGKKIYLADDYEALAAMRGNLPENRFFPKYRA
jgi:hypothetical protein